MQVSGFPNMIMPTGPQSGSASTNFPRGIEIGVDWATELLQYMWKHDYTREEATPEAEAEWGAHVAKLYGMMLMRKAQGWFTGLQLQRRRPRAGHDPLLRLQRRHAQVPRPHHRGRRQRLRGHRVQLATRSPSGRDPSRNPKRIPAP